MSYILEALKKSQQERELGQVPTLDASGLFVEDKQPVSHNYWVFLAVGLAALAVVIALYAAFRGGQQAERQTDEGPLTAETAEAQMPGLSPAPAVVPPGTPRAASSSTPTIKTVAPPLIEAPPPKRVARPIPPAPVLPADIPEPDVRESYEVSAGGTPDSAMEEALLRQLQAEQDALSETREFIDERPEQSAIPPDLVQDIESFKQRLRREKGLPPSKPEHKGVKITGDPTRLRLTAQQRAMVPAYLMTVHVYDEDPDKRFIVLNAMRYREGEDTLEGLRVEQILKEGAVLSHLGNPFYVAR
ncbi:GspB domain-containing protein [Thiorhodococcus mannitoliphagus]|uniref:GspB domain-containing protein n=1 Tax=Thiorhodococcus mannitoliphagus TaxID=329406 RepID=A0A6P1DQV3_9GAMM|nr:general secretion pathway protein GspB [Thiorhodococcus mannitoliphagus]NEX19056.1 GspB domain-containing protein [Thiorhodococcus mannitoliphagus]